MPATLLGSGGSTTVTEVTAGGFANAKSRPTVPRHRAPGMRARLERRRPIIGRPLCITPPPPTVQPSLEQAIRADLHQPISPFAQVGRRGRHRLGPGLHPSVD